MKLSKRAKVVRAMELIARCINADEEKIEALADFISQLCGEEVVNTGYYDPEEDKRNNEVDAYTGLYYVTVN